METCPEPIHNFQDGIMYSPDYWITLKILYEGNIVYKVLAGWDGNLFYGSSWRCNSGINKIEEDDEFYYFYGISGNTYQCNKSNEYMAGYMSAIGVDLLAKDNVQQISAEELKKCFNG